MLAHSLDIHHPRLIGIDHDDQFLNIQRDYGLDSSTDEVLREMCFLQQERLGRSYEELLEVMNAHLVRFHETVRDYLIAHRTLRTMGTYDERRLAELPIEQTIGDHCVLKALYGEALALQMGLEPGQIIEVTKALLATDMNGLRRAMNMALAYDKIRNTPETSVGDLCDAVRAAFEQEQTYERLIRDSNPKIGLTQVDLDRSNLITSLDSDPSDPVEIAIRLTDSMVHHVQTTTPEEVYRLFREYPVGLAWAQSYACPATAGKSIDEITLRNIKAHIRPRALHMIEENTGEAVAPKELHHHVTNSMFDLAVERYGSE